MGMSALYGEADRTESIATIHAYLDAVPTGASALLDTGDFYGMGHNEMLIGEALRTAPAAAREQALVSVKFGALRTVEGGFTGYDGRPEAVKNFLAYSLQRLGRDHIDIYRIARVDPAVPIEETIGAIAEAVEAGHVRHIGLSEVGADTLRRAAAVAPIADLQIEYSLISRGIEEEILPTARELGIGVTAYGVLSRGLISGHFSRDRELAPGDFRGMSPDSRARTCSATSTWSTPCARSRRTRGSASPRPRSPGCSRAARTSCRWWAPAAGTGCPRHWVPWTWS